MVYIPKVSFKTGINPSQLSKFPTDGKYSGTQKLLLTKTRIFGSKIGGNMASGVKPFNQSVRFELTDQHQYLQLHNIYRFAPFFRNHEQDHYYRARKERWAQAKLKKQAKKKKK